MFRKLFIDSYILLLCLLICTYIFISIILFKTNILSYNQIKLAASDNGSIVYFYLPIILVITMRYISIYKNKLLVIRNCKNLYFQIVVNFNILLSTLFLSIFLLLAYTDIQVAFHLTINLILIANIFLLIFVAVSFFTKSSVAHFIPIILYVVEVFLFQKYRTSLFNYYRLSIGYSIPIYFFISCSLFLIINSLNKVSDISV